MGMFSLSGFRETGHPRRGQSCRCRIRSEVVPTLEKRNLAGARNSLEKHFFCLDFGDHFTLSVAVLLVYLFHFQIEIDKDFKFNVLYFCSINLDSCFPLFQMLNPHGRVFRYAVSIDGGGSCSALGTCF